MTAALAAATAVLLAWTGVVKLLGRSSAAGLTALVRGERRAGVLLRLVGVVELAVAAALLAVPRAGGVAAAVLGVGFLGYLLAADRVAPGTSCGCAGSAGPVTWRGYARAAAVTLAGAAVGWYGVRGWDVAAAGTLAAALAGYVALSPELDRGWLRPLRRLRIRLFGHPLAGSADGVPVAASVELLETSLAWQATAHLVRSSLLEHWTTEGWRVLRYAGRHTPDDAADARPVTVLYAVDAGATTSAPRGTAVKVTVVDDTTGAVLAEPPLRVPDVRPLPLA